MRKNLNTTSVLNELRGASAFFSDRDSEESDKPKKPVQHVDMPAPQPAREANTRTSVVTNEQPNQRTNERKEIRHTFDIFADQLLSLKEIAIEREKVFGKRALLGDLVQEALDMFITKERNKD